MRINIPVIVLFSLLFIGAGFFLTAVLVISNIITEQVEQIPASDSQLVADLHRSAQELKQHAAGMSRQAGEGQLFCYLVTATPCETAMRLSVRSKDLADRSSWQKWCRR